MFSLSIKAELLNPKQQLLLKRSLHAIGTKKILPLFENNSIHSKQKLPLELKQQSNFYISKSNKLLNLVICTYIWENNNNIWVSIQYKWKHLHSKSYKLWLFWKVTISLKHVKCHTLFHDWLPIIWIVNTSNATLFRIIIRDWTIFFTKWDKEM